MTSNDRNATGIEGLDAILGGGFSRDRMFLVEGMPGSGKTTLALQFLLDGASRKETALHVTMSETEGELQAAAESHGWKLDGIHIRELIPTWSELTPENQSTMFHPSELELTERTEAILSDVERLNPTRIVFDSLSELRLLAGSSLRFRRQLLAFKRFFAGRRCTVLLLDDLTVADRELQVQSIAHGVVALEQMVPEYGTERRRLRVLKYRGATYLGGYHDFLLRRGGLVVFPRLVPGEDGAAPNMPRLASGIRAMDDLMGGGVDRGTSTLIVGAPGTGKSSLAARYVATAAERGERSTIFNFDENTHVFLTRVLSLGFDLSKHVTSGMVEIHQIDPARVSPGEFAHRIRRAANVGNTAIVVIDSLNGYWNSMPGETHLSLHLHDILGFLGQRGVATIMVGTHQGFVGGTMATPVDASYLADAIILLRYFEWGGEARQAISVVKKRGGAHERTIRQFRMDERGIHIGEPLREFRGVLTGVPTYEGEQSPLLDEDPK